MARKLLYPELSKLEFVSSSERTKQKSLHEITDPEAILQGAKVCEYVIRLKNHNGDLLDYYLQAPQGWVPKNSATTYVSREVAKKALIKMPWIKNVEIELK